VARKKGDAVKKGVLERENRTEEDCMEVDVAPPKEKFETEGLVVGLIPTIEGTEVNDGRTSETEA